MGRAFKARFSISNTTEAGISFNSSDSLSDCPQGSFPGKVSAFLYERYRHFKGDITKGLIFLPCELIDKNGLKLKECIMQYADLWQLSVNLRIGLMLPAYLLTHW